jgi:crotonobetainyl-CoA:carnitine CoA-transferase CaiB-like acyl-CoA transferase
MSLALDGIKVLDISQAAAVPMAARHLADFGADVIHVEHPETGDSWRGNQEGATRPGSTYTPASEVNYTYETVNRNKRSLTLDISKEGGQTVLYKLLEETDVLTTNMRPTEQEAYRIDYATLQERYPRLIHATLFGLGKNGPEKDQPAYDVTAYLFRSGMNRAMASPLIGEQGWRNAFGDVTAGMALFGGVMTALFTRERTGLGQQVDTSLFAMGVHQMSFDMNGFMVTGTDFRELEAKALEEMAEDPERQTLLQLGAEAREAVARLQEESLRLAGAPLASTYTCKDGLRFKIMILLPERYFPRLCRAIEREDLMDDPRFATFDERLDNASELYTILRDAFLTKTLDQWRPILIRELIPWSPEQSFRDVYNDPQAQANDFFVPIDHPTHGPMEVVDNPLNLSRTPPTVRLPAPEFSQHTEEILLEFGYSWEDIIELKEKDIIA